MANAPRSAPRQRMEYPDLRKNSPEYQAHQSVIREIMAEVDHIADIVKTAIAQTERRMVGVSIHSKQPVPDRNLPSMNAIDKEDRVNCKGLEFLFHSVGMECYRRENDGKWIADLRPILERIASTRLSIMNFNLTQQATDHTKTIRGIDARLRDLVGTDVEVPSLVPFYFTPNSTLTELKRQLGSRKFEDPEILMDLGVLFASDSHVFHSICMALATNGMPEHIEPVLLVRAEAEFPRFGKHALTPLLQMNPDLFVAHTIGLVESGQTARALTWCEKEHFRGLLTQRAELALKYIAALRHQGRFQEAMEFCSANKSNPALQDRRFGQEFKMASVQCPDIMPMTLDEFQRRYPNA